MRGERVTELRILDFKVSNTRFIGKKLQICPKPKPHYFSAFLISPLYYGNNLQRLGGKLYLYLYVLFLYVLFLSEMLNAEAYAGYDMVGDT